MRIQSKVLASGRRRRGRKRAATELVAHVERVLSGEKEARAQSPHNDIASSWQRSAASQIDPASAQAPRVLTAGEVKPHREPIAELIAQARGELDRLGQIVRSARYTVLLCNSRGVAVEHRGDQAEAEQFRYWGIWLGGVWSEDFEGTNGIGTCIVTKRPIDVHRTEHFRARHIGLSCSGAPIFGDDGKLAAVLDVSSFDPALSEQAHALTGALVRSSARAIEQRWFRSRHRRNWVVTVRPSDPDGQYLLFAVDDDHRIVGADRNGRLWLRNASKQDTSSLWSVFERSSLLFDHKDAAEVATPLFPIGSSEPWTAMVSPPQFAQIARATLDSRPNPELFLPDRRNSVKVAELTPRERAVLERLLKGFSSKQIAKKLGISPRTVEFHRANIMRKLGARNATELVAKVLGVDDDPAQRPSC